MQWQVLRANTTAVRSQYSSLRHTKLDRQGSFDTSSSHAWMCLLSARAEPHMQDPADEEDCSRPSVGIHGDAGAGLRRCCVFAAAMLL